VLDPGWSAPELGSEQLIKVVLLYQLYPGFYNVLVDEDSAADPVGAFLDYVALADRSENWRPLAERVFSSYGATLRADNLAEALDQLEQSLPEALPELTRDKDLVSLLKSMGEPDDREAIRAQLMRSPLRGDRVVSLAGLRLNALTDQLRSEVMASEGSAATERAQYEELQIESDASNPAASAVARAAREKMRANTEIFRGFDQLIE
jgi:hypothetical protein